MFSPQKCWEDSQLSPTGAGHSAPVWGFHWAVAPKCHWVFHCRTGRLWALLYSLLFFFFFFLGVLLKKQQSVSGLYCVPPFNGTLSRRALTARNLQSVYVNVCFFFLSTSPLSWISSLTYLWAAVIVRPPWVNINLLQQPTSHIMTFLYPLSPPLLHCSTAAHSTPSFTILLHCAHPFVSCITINRTLKSVHSPGSPLRSDTGSGPLVTVPSIVSLKGSICVTFPLHESRLAPCQKCHFPMGCSGLITRPSRPHSLWGVDGAVIALRTATTPIWFVKRADRTQY